jgi:hypothetical protein
MAIKPKVVKPQVKEAPKLPLSMAEQLRLLNQKSDQNPKTK